MRIADDDIEREAIQGEPSLRVVDREKRVRNATDLGNGERIAELCRGDMRHCTDRRRWIGWDGVQWKWDDGTKIHRLAKKMVRGIYTEAANSHSEAHRKLLAKHAVASEKSARIAAAIDLARYEDGIPIDFSAFDSDPWLLNCANGTIDLRTGNLCPHSRDDLITKSTGRAFRPEARSELWQRVLSSATGDDEDLARYLQRMAGYACAGVATERAFWLLYGLASTSKSAVLDALLSALGEYAISADAETFLAHSNVGGNRGDLVRMAGTRLVVAAEIRKGARWDEAVIKRITGGDEIIAAAKYEGEVSFRASCTLVLAANDAPAARDDDAGFWARCRRVPFDNVIPLGAQIRDLKDQLRKPEHAEAILAWAVRGCLMWQRDGIGACRAVEKSTEAYRFESDRFAEFLEDCCEFVEGMRISRRHLRHAYESWAKEVGHRTLLSSRKMSERLHELGVGKTKYAGDRCWLGLRLQGDRDD